MHTSESIAKISEAIAKAQGKLKKAVKDSTNPHFKSRYADLESVLDAMRDAFASEQLAVVQSVSGGAMLTRVSHPSGEWIETSLPIWLPENATAQQIGSSVSYARRYSLAMTLSIAQTDDDAEALMNRAPATPPPAPKPVQRKVPVPETLAPVATEPTATKIDLVPYDDARDAGIARSALFKSGKSQGWVTQHKAALKAYLSEHSSNDPNVIANCIAQYVGVNP